MIKANELRIGNLIFDHEDEPHYFEVEEIKKEKGFDGLCIVYRNGCTKAIEVEPIVLNSHHLQDYDYFSITNGVTWAHDADGEELQIADDDGMWGVYWYGSFLRHIEYLHELQNIFFLLKSQEIY